MHRSKARLRSYAVSDEPHCAAIHTQERVLDEHVSDRSCVITLWESSTVVLCVLCVQGTMPLREFLKGTRRC